MKPDMLTAALVTLLAFVAGSLPCSVWLGRVILRKDVRHFGDGNPGATNVFRAGGRMLFPVALILDVAKGAVPVAWAYHALGIREWAMFPIALAPILGHAFSPFLGFRGGKALAVTLGVWIGIAVWPVPLAAVVGIVVWRTIVAPTGWAVMLTLAGMMVAVLRWSPQPMFIAALASNTLVLVWTHRLELRHGPRLRSGMARLLHRTNG